MGKIWKNYKLKTGIFLESAKEEVSNILNYSNENYTVEIRKIVQAIKRDGYYVLKGYYGRDRCAALCADIERILEERRDIIQVDTEQSDHRIWGAERFSNLIKEFHSDEYLLRIGKAYLKTKIINYLTLGAKLISVENNVGSGGGWHRDTGFSRQFKAIIYLSDVNEKNGPYQYIKGSNSLKNVIEMIDVKSEPPFTRLEDVDFDSLCAKTGRHLETICGQAGDTILTDTRGIHRGMPIKAGVRFALTNYYVSKHKSEQFVSYFEEVLK